MWNVFRVTNLLWLFISTFWWVTAGINQGPFLVVINIVMIICLTMMPLKITFNHQIGRIVGAIVLASLWSIWIDGPVMGILTILMYFPAVYLLQLPFVYKRDLLAFTTKWYAILLSISLVIYWASLFINLPSIGMFVQPPYSPFKNYIFFIKTTYDSGFLLRFNAFFLEPGHQAILSVFIMIANRFNFRECLWLWPLIFAVLFSFSLAGYVLLFIGYCLLKINTLWKAIGVAGLCAIVIAIAINYTGGNNALNDLILARLEKDDSQGIKGNNRFSTSTDFIFSQAEKKGDLMFGVQDKTNMELVGGAGYKVFVLNNGLLGVILTLLIYLSFIPPRPNYRYTITFLVLLVLCFLQRSYPTWYSWLFPYVIGIYLAKGEKENDDNSDLWQPKTISE